MIPKSLQDSFTLHNGVKIPCAGCLPLLKSVTPERIRANTEIFDFVLEDADINAIASTPDSDNTPFSFARKAAEPGFVVFLHLKCKEAHLILTGGLL